MDAVSNNKLANTENHLKDFLQTVLSSEGIVVDIRRTFIEYNGVNRSRAFARHAGHRRKVRGYRFDVLSGSPVDSQSTGY